MVKFVSYYYVYLQNIFYYNRTNGFALRKWTSGKEKSKNNNQLKSAESVMKKHFLVLCWAVVSLGVCLISCKKDEVKKQGEDSKDQPVEEEVFVSKEPSKCVAVIEEYGGVDCQYCPDGHRIVEEIMESNPNSCVAINIHAGSYASKYTTNFGQQLLDQIDRSGFPAATVNRHYFSDLAANGGTAMSRAYWQTAVNRVLNWNSPVNVAAIATIDRATRTMTVEVQAYYTSNGKGQSNKLNVALLQDNIVGYQSGASFNPDQIVPGGYNHMHVLRHLITGQWGEDITTISAGTLVKKTYTYQIPTYMSDANVNLDDLRVVVFMAESRQEIITGAKAQMVIK